MSINKPWTFRSAVFESELSASTKLVLLVVASYVNDMGDPAWPSYNTIGKKASLSRSTVIAHLNLAIDKGWISKQKRKGKDGLSETNLYRLQTPDQSFQSDESAAPVDEVPHILDSPVAGLPLEGGSANAGLPQSKCRTGVVQRLDPNMSIELSIELSSKPSDDATASPALAKAPPKKKEPAETTPVWEAYADAYTKRYSIPPLRNAKVNTSLKNIVSQVGAERAGDLVRHYLTLDGFYEQRSHDIGVLVSDLQKVWNSLHNVAVSPPAFATKSGAFANKKGLDGMDYSKGFFD
jgi:hypothetical protein